MGSRVLFPLTAIVLIGVFAALSLAGTGGESAGVDGKLSDDDGGAPLFSAGALRPGEQVSGCISINYSGTKDAPVTLSGRGSGALDQYLDVEVERGSDGGYGNCAGFTGAKIFEGTLAEFLRTGDSAQSAIPAWTASGGEPSRTFKISVALRDVAEAQGQTASASFEWSAPAKEDPPAPGGSDPDPATPPAAAPTTSPRTKRPPATMERAHRDSRTPRSIDSPGKPGGRGGPLTGSPAGDDNGFLDAVKDIAVGAGKRIAFPSFLALLAFLFLLVQNRLDRRDPKLSMAPKRRDEDLEFGPLPWAGAGSS